MKRREEECELEESEGRKWEEECETYKRGKGESGKKKVK
jgi:hypothetical protein